MYVEKIKTSLEKLESWIEAYGWAGYDPYDVKGHPLFLRLDGAKSRVLRKLSIELNMLFPVQLRRLFRIRPALLPEALALLALGYLERAKTTRMDANVNKAVAALDLLLKHRADMEGGYLGWGLTFDWRSRILIPRGTMAATTTVLCGEAFWRAYLLTEEPRYLDTCVSVARTLAEKLNIDNITEETLCFSYTPLDSFHVHNANVMVASYLVRIGKHLSKPEYTRLGQAALLYTLNDQREDGAFEYWGPPDRQGSHIDHYHTGFVLQTLAEIYKMTGAQVVRRALEKGFRYYRARLFTDNGIPKHSPDRVLPVNIKSCAEAILAHTVVESVLGGDDSRLEQVVPWVLTHMQDVEGFFYYALARRILGYAFFVRIPYVRWSQASMFYALAKLLSFVESENPRGASVSKDSSEDPGILGTAGSWKSR